MLLGSRTAAPVPKFRFPSKGGIAIEAEVNKTGPGYCVVVHVPEETLKDVDGPMLLHWGVYRSTVKQWLHPKSMVPPGSAKDEVTGAMRSPMMRQGDGRFRLEFNIPGDMAPVTLACTACKALPGDTAGKVAYTQLLSGLHCAIPIAMAPGKPGPLGATVERGDNGKSRVHFAVVSRTAATMALVLIRDKSAQGAENTCLEVALDAVVNKTGNVWHVELADLDLTNLHYGWRADGDQSWEGGGRFHPAKVMMDPYSRRIAELTLPEAACLLPGGPHKAWLGSLEWQPVVHQEEEAAPAVPLEAMVAREVDVVDFTAVPSVPAEHQGKLLGIIDRLPELQALGVNALVLAPICAQLPGMGPFGRAALNYFSPDPALATTNTAAGAQTELKQVVTALHAAGIEVIVQFEFCFTVEGTDEDPKAMSFRGIDSAVYYRPNGVLNCGQVVVRNLIQDALRHWAIQYQLDGFGLLNAETLCQDSNSIVLDSPPLVEALALDPVLRHMKLLAYVGNDSLLPRSGERGFPHWGVLMQVNADFSRIATSYMAGAKDQASAVATAMTGSPNLFAARLDAGLPGCLATGRRPAFGMNSLAPLPGGKTLTRLAAEAVHPSIAGGSLRGHPAFMTEILPAARALLVMQIMATGTPIVAFGESEDASLVRFAGQLLKLRAKHADTLSPPEFATPRSVQWHGAHCDAQPDWDGTNYDHAGQVIAVSLGDVNTPGIYIALNPHNYEVDIHLPAKSPKHPWGLCVDTSLSGTMACQTTPQALINPGNYIVKPFSAVVMVAT